MKITELEIKRMSNFSDDGLLRYFQGNKDDLNTVIEKTKPLAAAARLSKQTLAAEKLEDLIESVTKIKAQRDEN